MNLRAMKQFGDMDSFFCINSIGNPEETAYVV